MTTSTAAVRSAFATLAILFATVGCSNAERDTSSAESAPSQSADADFRDMLAEAGRRQGVEVTWTGGPFRYESGGGSGTAEDASDEDVARVAGAVARELSQYPDGFLARNGVTGVILVRDLFVAEDGGARAAAAYAFGDRLVFDTQFAFRALEAGTRVRFIHHLIWHWLDERAGTMWNDPEWVALNPPDFEYGVHSRGGVHETRANSGALTTEFPGFLNLYSTGNLPDDKAEVFAYLMVIHSWLEDHGSQDDHVRRKVALLKTRLAALDPGFDAAFWDRIDADSDDASRYGLGS